MLSTIFTRTVSYTRYTVPRQHALKSITTCLHLRNEFDFWKVHGVHGIMNTLGLLQRDLKYS